MDTQKYRHSNSLRTYSEFQELRNNFMQIYEALMMFPRVEDMELTDSMKDIMVSYIPQRNSTSTSTGFPGYVQVQTFSSAEVLFRIYDSDPMSNAVCLYWVDVDESTNLQMTEDYLHVPDNDLEVEVYGSDYTGTSESGYSLTGFDTDTIDNSILTEEGLFQESVLCSVQETTGQFVHAMLREVNCHVEFSILGLEDTARKVNELCAPL